MDGLVRLNDERLIVTKHGKPAVAIITVKELEALAMEEE